MSISRVIEVSFGGGSIAYAKVDTAYFYNNGILFKPTDIDLPTSYQVHWADSPQASSTLETIGTAEGAPIPDDLWNRSRVIYGWIYLHPTEDSGVTGYEVRIYKNVRAGLPDGTEPTPAEQSTIDQLIGALNSAVEQTGEDVESAEQAKDDAESARDNAQTYANNAQTSAQASARSAESASQSAQTASEKATASAQSASQSAQIKSDIEGMVDDAQGYADSASQSASQASASEQGCARAVLDAASAAAIARARADEASGYAQTASTKASEAVESVETASQKAAESAQSATSASQSAQTAEQAKTASQTAQGLAENARDTAVSAKTDAESARDDAVQAKEDAESAVASIADALDDKAPVITDTASGSIASFSDGADDLPLKSLVIDINPVQDLSHGDPSPENLCPISGWTEVDVEQRRVNLYSFDSSRLSTGVTSTSTTRAYYDLGISGKTITVSANKKGSASASNSVNLGKLSNGILTIINSFVYGSGETTRTYTFGDNETAVFMYSTPNETALQNDLNKYNIQVELGSTATPYEPYTGRSITIDLGQTVYGGKVDVLSGELVIDRAMVDLGTLTWTYYVGDSFAMFITSAINDIKKVAGWRGICSIYGIAMTNIQNIADKMISTAYGDGRIRVKDSRFTDVNSFVADVGGQTLVYELATPIEIQLSANQINSLYGVNNLWADSGDTEVEYRADTKAWIQKKIAEAIASLT